MMRENALVDVIYGRRPPRCTANTFFGYKGGRGDWTLLILADDRRIAFQRSAGSLQQTGPGAVSDIYRRLVSGPLRAPSPASRAPTHFAQKRISKQKKARTSAGFLYKRDSQNAFHALKSEDGAPDGIRTHDPCLRRAVLYPAELLVQRGRHNTHLGCVRPWWRAGVVDFARFRRIGATLIRFFSRSAIWRSFSRTGYCPLTPQSLGFV